MCMSLTVLLGTGNAEHLNVSPAPEVAITFSPHDWLKVNPNKFGYKMPRADETIRSGGYEKNPKSNNNNVEICIRIRL